MTTTTTCSNELTINGTIYVKKDSLIPEDSDTRIVILQRGWVMIGVYNEEKDRVWLDNAFNIRRWGTTKGLKELDKGPTDKTIYDYMGRVDFHILTVIATIMCGKGSIKCWQV